MSTYAIATAHLRRVACEADDASSAELRRLSDAKIAADAAVRAAS